MSIIQLCQLFRRKLKRLYYRYLLSTGGALSLDKFLFFTYLEICHMFTHSFYNFIYGFAEMVDGLLS